MKLDPKVLDDLAVLIKPNNYLRITGMAYAATPLGMGHGASRFASPRRSFQLIYISGDLATGIAETIVRDRFQGRAGRRLAQEEVEGWGIAAISALSPLTVIDLRTTGLLRLGVSTDAARAKSQIQGRRLGQAIYDGTDVDGLLYLSRLTGMICVAVYDRAVSAKLAATPVEEIVTRADFVPALMSLNVQLIGPL